MIFQGKIFSLSVIIASVLTFFVQTPFVQAKELQLRWPVKGEITAKFHDKDYRFSNLFQHTGIDIAVPQDTEIRSAISGVVSKIKRPKKQSYSYVFIVGKNGISTVYGNLHGVNVKRNQLVTTGDVIGLSGGLPGTKGADMFSTHSHLHFELRKEGIPVNPIKYLP